MKKIFVINVLFLLALTAMSQEKTAKITQANNDVPKELMINGKPYSQYKAEQDALKQQKQQQSVAPVSGLTIISNKGVDNSAATVRKSIDFKIPAQVTSVKDDPAQSVNIAIVPVNPDRVNPAAADQKPVIIEQPSIITTGETLKTIPVPVSDNKAALTEPKNDKPVIAKQPDKMAVQKQASPFTGSGNSTINNKPVVETKKVEQVAAKQQTKPAVVIPVVDVFSGATSNNTTPVAATPLNKPVKSEQSLQQQSSSVNAPKTVVETKLTKPETKTAAETMPAVLKGSSLDPDAKPVMKAVEKTAAAVPQQNSANTAVPDTKQPVTKEDATVPSSTKPVKKN